jgi:hypothetical protein
MVVLARARAAAEGEAEEREDDLTGAHGGSDLPWTTLAHAWKLPAMRLLFVVFLLFGFADGGTLDRVRRDPALASDARAIDELVREADASPPGPERVDAWVLAAEAYAQRLDRPADAERLYRRIVSDAAADDVLRRKAQRDLVTLLVARGDLDGAAVAARGQATLVAEVARLVRRRWLHLASIGTLAVLGLLTARALLATRAAGVKPALRRIAPLALAFALYVGVAGAVLASRYEGGTAQPFLVLGGGLFLLLLAARAWGATGGRSGRARVVRAVVCGAGALATAFLVLETIDASYLDGMGL